MDEARSTKTRPPLEVRWNLVWYLVIGAGLIGWLANIEGYGKEVTALIGAGAALLGVAGSAVKQLIAPAKRPADPVTDEGRITPRGAARIWIAVTGKVPEDIEAAAAVSSGPPAFQLRVNLHIVMVLGSAFVITLAYLFPAAAPAVIALAYGLLGYGGGAVLELVAPSPPEPDPEIDEGKLTPKGAERMIHTARKGSN